MDEPSAFFSSESPSDSSLPPQPFQRVPPNVRRRLRQTVQYAIPFGLGVCAVLVAIVIYGHFTPAPTPLTARDVQTTVAETLASATPLPAYSALVYQAIQPSLVLIQVKTTDTQGKPGEGLGSGVVVDSSGDILTALHVVSDSTTIQVTFADGTQSSAQVTTKQPENDIAVLHTDKLPAQLVPATLGNPNAMHVGDEAYVVGNPFGLYSSMTAGVISGFERSFQMPNSTQKIQHLIQIDAPVNPGNSGGPLLNRSGQVVGIVEGLLNPNNEDVFIGIGFAVPITIAGGAAGLPLD